MIVNNPNFRRRNYPSLSAFKGLGAVDYSAIKDCSMLTIWQQQEAPQCQPGGGGSGMPGVFVAPNLVPSENCDPFDTACVDRNTATEFVNEKLWAKANQAVFLTNCHNMIASENANRSPGTPLYIDDCDTRTFGLSPILLDLPTTPINNSIQNQTANQTPITQSPQVVTQPQQQQVVQHITATSGGATNNGVIVSGSGPQDLIKNMISGAESKLQGDVSVLGHDIPLWGIAAVVIGGLFLMGGK